jgi:hypothetical protein
MERTIASSGLLVVCSHERRRGLAVAWRKSAPRVVLFALRAPSLFVLNVRRCDRCTCALCRLRTRNRSSPLRCFPLWCPAGNPASPEGAHIASPQAPPPSSPLPRASLPCDCPILRPRAGLLLSRACDFPFAMSFGATYAHASPSSLRHAVGCCMSAPRHVKRPSSLQPLVCPYLYAAESRMQPNPLYTSLLFAGWSRCSSTL